MNLLAMGSNRQHGPARVQGYIRCQGERVASAVRMLTGNSSGFLLLEAAIASTVFSMVGVAVLVGLSNAYSAGAKTEVQSVAENTVRNQMEFVFSQQYREPQQTPYPTVNTVPSGYTLNTTVADFDAANPDPETERITVSATYDGQQILSLETIRGRDDGLQLRYGSVNDRSGDGRLQDKTLDGIVYVFLDDPEGIASEARFYLDGVGPPQTEIFIPWDFKGGSVATANPWDTETDPFAFDGAHKIMAQVDLIAGGTINVTADFSVDNS